MIKKLLNPKVFLVIISIQLGIILFLKISLTNEEITLINRILVTSTGIFSAIIISTLLSGISKLFKDFDDAEEKISPLSQKLTSFRRVLYYLTISIDIWGDDFYQYSNKLRGWYPKIDAYTSKHNVDESDPRFEIVADNKFEEYRTRLFMKMLTIVDVKRGRELDLIESFQHTYSVNKIGCNHDLFNNIWYYLAHKRSNVTINYDTVDGTFKNSFEKELANFVDDEEIKKFSARMLWDISNEFYFILQPKLYLLTRKISDGLPSLYKKLFFDLSALVIFGLVIPIINLVTEASISEVLTRVSIVAVLMIFCYTVYHLKEFIFDQTKKFVEKYQ